MDDVGFVIKNNYFSCWSLNIPPSINKTYKTSQSGGFFMSKNAKEWKQWFSEMCFWTLKKDLAGNKLFEKDFEEELCIILHWFITSRSDIDNRNKILLDALQNGGVFANDKNILTKITHKHIVKKSHQGFMCVCKPLAHISEKDLLRNFGEETKYITDKFACIIKN